MSSNFKLLMTTDVTSGIWNYSIMLCNSLKHQINTEILLVSFGGEPTKQQVSEVEQSNFKIIYTDYPSDWANYYQTELTRFNQFKNELNSIINEFNPTLIHFNHPACSLIQAGFPNIIVWHSDTLNWNKWVFNRGRTFIPPKHLKLFKDVIKKGIDQTEFIVTPSRFVAEDIIRTYEYKGKIKIIHNGITFEPSENIPEKPSLLMVGRLWDKAKNLNLLFKVASKLPDGIKIRIAGEILPNTRLPKNVEYLGYLSRDELQNVYRKSSIYLALSSYEPFGLPLVEAAYSNCAIIANNIPTFQELWGDCACIFERNNINSLIRSINNLVENEKLLQFTAKSCQAKALSAYNSKRMCFEYLNLYKNILHKSKCLNTQKQKASVQEQSAVK